MKPLSTGALAGLLFASVLVQGTSAAWEATYLYDGASCANSLGYASITDFSACTAGSCTAGSWVACTTDATTVKASFASKFGTTPFVLVSTFSGSTCTGTPATVSGYAADGSCHNIDTNKYYKVPITAGAGTATIKFFTESSCTTAHADPDIEVRQAVVSAGTGSTLGCNGATSASRFEFSTLWPTAMKAPTSFDGGDCTKRANLVSITADTCTADTACASGAGVICTTNYKYDSAIATAYGVSTPYITVSTYNTGPLCAWSTLASAKAYTADGKCRVITSGSKYYKVIFSAGTDTATIKFFTEATCTTAHTDSDISITQAALALGSGSGCDGNTPATKYTFSTSWPTAQKAVTTYDGGDCGNTLGFISLAAGATCTNGADADCVATTGGEICTSNINYELAIAAKFASAPFLTIARYSAGACTWSTFTSAKAYLADGKCHQYDTNKYYKLSAVPIGGGQEPKILGFTDAACTTADTTANIEVSKSKLVTGCDTTTSGGATHYKVSANWPKAMSVVGVGAYTVPTTTGAACAGGVPSKLTLTDASVGNAVCGATRACSSTTALADCTTVTDYKTYLKTAFGSVPYLVKETYSTGCATLSSVLAWAADGTCYEDGAGSFKAVVTSTGVSVKTWSAVKDCSGTSTGETAATAAQLASNVCVSNIAKYYMGGSWVFASNAVYDDSNCALTPNKITLGLAPTCAAPTGDAACLTTTSTATTPLTVYNAPGCAKATSSGYFAAIDKAFGMTTYVVQESYTASCDSLIGVTAYVADAKCHLGADAISSYNVTYDVNGTTAQVKIDSFTNTGCTAPVATTASVAATAIAGKTCVGDTKTYVGGLATQLTAVTTYSDKECKVPVQTVFTSLATTCTASAATACTSAGGGLYTRTACTNAKTDYAAVLATVYGTTRRLVSDIYEAKDAKCGVRQGIVAYVGDGKCYTTLDSTFFKVTLGSSNTATDATFSTFSDKECTKDEKALKIASANLATATTAPCDTTNFIKWSIGGTEPVTEAPATDAPTPAPTTAVSTGSGKSAAVSSFSVSIFGLLASILGGLTVLLN